MKYHRIVQLGFTLLLCGVGGVFFWGRSTVRVPDGVAEGVEARGGAVLLHEELMREAVRGLDTNQSVRGAGIYLQAGTVVPEGFSDDVAHVRPSARGYPWMVLYATPIREEHKQALVGLGVTVKSYLPDFALLVEAPAAALGAIRHLPDVAGGGAYRPEYKIQPFLSALIGKENPEFVAVTVLSFDGGDVEGIQAFLRDCGAREVSGVSGRRRGIVKALLPGDVVGEVAALPEVQWLEYDFPHGLSNDRARYSEALQVDNLFTNFNLDGAGQIIGHADTGLDSGDTNTIHPDFVGRVLHAFALGRSNDWSDTHYHGTHTAASILGTGAASDGQFRGTAPAAKLVHQSVANSANQLTGLPADLNDLFQPPYDLNARIHADSWGQNYSAGLYTTDAMTSDEFVWDHPDMLIVFAAGNDASDGDWNGIVDPYSVSAPSTAKNVLSVGAAESGRAPGSGGLTATTYGSAWPIKFLVAPISDDYISQSDDNLHRGLAGFSGRGPAADGRFKPDVVAPGTDVISCYSRRATASTWGLYASNTNYCFAGGTSMATPLVAGLAALLRQHCVENLGIPNPSAALLKAVLTGGSRSLSPGQYGEDMYREIPDLPRPNFMEGWGMPALDDALFPAEPVRAILVDAGRALATGEQAEFPFCVVEGGHPLTISMAYTDYPATSAAAKTLVNDLDVSVIRPDQSVLYPNGFAMPDRLNNVEGMDVAAAEEGLWGIRVEGYNAPEGPQPFALYVRGAVAFLPVISHEPLQNQRQEKTSYSIAAEVTCLTGVDTNSVRLHWGLSTNVGAMTTQVMTTADGVEFHADIPAAPLGSTIYYYLSAGADTTEVVHPAAAPREFHSFDITETVVLFVDEPADDSIFISKQSYYMAAGTKLVVKARPPKELGEGIRGVCIGWTGTGSVPPEGHADTVELVVMTNSYLKWIREKQYALTEASSPDAVASTQTWWSANSEATSGSAPEIHPTMDDEYVFYGWELDGARHPPAPAPSFHVISNIVMEAPRQIVAMYMPATTDRDENGLPDWFELRYFGAIGQHPYADADGDGWDNQTEALDHTNPLDAASVPQPPVIQVEAPLGHQSTPAPWTVSATITDNFKVAAANLFWTRNGGITRSAAMTRDATTAANWTGQISIPGRSGDSFIYYITASDEAGFFASSTLWTFNVAYPQLQLSTNPIVIDMTTVETNLSLEVGNIGLSTLDIRAELLPVGLWDDMENGTNGWVHSGTNDLWHLDAEEAHSPDMSWYCAYKSIRQYPNDCDARLDTPPIRLSHHPALTFVHKAAFEFDTTEVPDGLHYWDGARIEISTDSGATWSVIDPVGGYPNLVTPNPASPFPEHSPIFGSVPDWTSVEFDLADYSGMDALLRFRFGSDSYTAGGGWHIDDVNVTPCTRYTLARWGALSNEAVSLASGSSAQIELTFNALEIPLLETDEALLLIHHNDPERKSPISIPVRIKNNNPSVEINIQTSGPGRSDPAGRLYQYVGDSFAVTLTAHSNAFIFSATTNGGSVPLPDVETERHLEWDSLTDDLDVSVVFAEQMADAPGLREWLNQHNLTNQNWMTEALSDADHDGLLNWQEYELGSDPRDAADAPLIVSLIAPVNTLDINGHWNMPLATNYTLEWHAFSNMNLVYHIWISSNLMGVGGAAPFVPWLTNIPAQPPHMTSPPLPMNGSPLFFHLQQSEASSP